MKLAVISDIHSNTTALKAVLADIATRNVEQIICLGDVIGYGPEPAAALDLVMKAASVTLMGNHDYAVLYEPNKFNLGAETASFWTRKQLEDEPDAALRKARWDFLGSLKVKHVIDGGTMLGEMVFVHGSPRRPINEYIFPDDVITAPTKMQQIFDRIDHKCFVGHTHVVGVFTDEPDFYPPADLNGVYLFHEEEKCIVNPGSVGQPRDRDPRASYAVLHDDRVEFLRLDYPVEAVIEKVKAVPELHDFLGQRLLEGR